MNDHTTSVLRSQDGTISRITLNRPEKRNALNGELIAELTNALRVSVDADETRAIIISAAGPDFCSGADLASLQKISEASVAENVDDARSLLNLFVLIRQVPLPVIAAVHGRALAGGCGLATACDLVLASSSARFGYPEVKIGFVPAMVLAILRRNVSEKHAFELLTRGRQFGAQEAKELGLVNEVFGDETFAQEVIAYTKKFEGTSKSAVALTKSLLYQVDGFAYLEALETGADVNVIARMTEDCQKGITRFLGGE